MLAFNTWIKNVDIQVCKRWLTYMDQSSWSKILQLKTPEMCWNITWTEILPGTIHECLTDSSQVKPLTPQSVIYSRFIIIKKSEDQFTDKLQILSREVFSAKSAWKAEALTASAFRIH